MTSGKHLNENDRYQIIDMNAQRNEDGHCRFTFHEIALRCNVSHRTVSLIIREHSAAARRREREQERMHRLTEPE